MSTNGDGMDLTAVPVMIDTNFPENGDMQITIKCAGVSMLIEVDPEYPPAILFALIQHLPHILNATVNDLIEDGT
jgi:hypothetical protein